MSEKIYCERFAVYFESRLLLYQKKCTAYFLQFSLNGKKDGESTKYFYLVNTSLNTMFNNLRDKHTIPEGPVETLLKAT